MKREINFIVVHCNPSVQTATADAAQVNNAEANIHYKMTARAKMTKSLPEGRNSHLGSVTGNECLCIGVEPGLHRNGLPRLTRSQETVLFDKIVQLTERYPGATVVGSDHLEATSTSSQPFNVRSWLASYVPDIALAA